MCLPARPRLETPSFRRKRHRKIAHVFGRVSLRRQHRWQDTSNNDPHRSIKVRRSADGRRCVDVPVNSSNSRGVRQRGRQRPVGNDPCRRKIVDLIEGLLPGDLSVCGGNWQWQLVVFDITLALPVVVATASGVRCHRSGVLVEGIAAAFAAVASLTEKQHLIDWLVRGV